MLTVEFITSLMVQFLAIASQFIPVLLVFSVGVYLANLACKTIKIGTRRNRLLGKAACFAIATLFVTVACQPTWTTDVSLDSASGLAKETVSRSEPQDKSRTWTNVSIGGGGYVTGIYLHPQEKHLIYIKTDVGGFYRWNSNTQSWIPLTDSFTLEQGNYYSGEALALDPNNPDIVYIAAGAYTADWWPHKGSLFKSKDRGQTWTKLNLDLKMGGNEDLRWVGERLAVNPSNSNILLFGSRKDGLWRSSDGGATWTPVNFPGKPDANIGISAIAFDKQTAGLVYAIAYGDSIYQSSDAGVTWRKISQSPAKAKRMVAASNGVLYVTHSDGISKYVKSSWSNITPFGNAATFNALSVHPTDPNRILVSLGETTKTKIFQSLDGGTTWTEKKRAINNTVSWWTDFLLTQPSISALEFDPDVPERAWLTDWYGIWRTENINANPIVWKNYQQGHEEIVTFTLASPPRGSLLFSGVADVDGFNHSNQLNTYPTNTFGSSGPSFQDTYSIAYSESNPLQLVRVGGNRWNSTYTGATSTNGGLTWKPFGSFPANTMPLRIALSATNPNLYVVTISEGQPLRSTDGGASWTSVSGLPNGVKGPWNWSQSLAADKVDGNTFYYYAWGKVYRSTDGGLSFEVINPSLPSEEWHSLKTFPGVAGEVWLSLDRNGLYRSTDGGKTLAKIPAVERAHLFSFGKPPTGSNVAALYLYGTINGRGEGIFQSLDRGKTWINITDPQQPVGNNPRFMEASRQVFGLVFIGTGGRGIYYRSP